jgi:hypothetical protein
MITIGIIHQRCAPKFFFIHQWHVDCTHTLHIVVLQRPARSRSLYTPPPFNGPDENAFNCSATWWWLGRPNPKRMRYRQTLINLDTRRKKSKHKIPGNT